MSGLKVFELLEDLAVGKSARARLLNWRGDGYTPSAFATVIVHDFVGEHAAAGTRGYCFLSEESHRWEVLRGLNPQGVQNPPAAPAAEDHAESRRAPGLFPALASTHTEATSRLPFSTG